MHLFQLLRRDYVGIYTTVIEEKNTNMVSADDDSGIPSLPGIKQSTALSAGPSWPPAAVATAKHRHFATMAPMMHHAFNS